MVDLSETGNDHDKKISDYVLCHYVNSGAHTVFLQFYHDRYIQCTLIFVVKRNLI